jgi:hypothetical protein
LEVVFIPGKAVLDKISSTFPTDEIEKQDQARQYQDECW